MQMTINFKNLFNLQDPTFNTPSISSIENSYHIDESSIMSTQSNKINIHYKFNEAFFFDSSQDNDQNINILEDLSSIGRSSQDDLERESQILPVYSSKQQLNFVRNTNHNNNKTHNQKQAKSQHTFYMNEKDNTKSPGERLYYESKIKNQRKLKQLERIKMQLQQEEKKEATFKPALNEKSKRILQIAESPFRKLQNMKKSEKNQQLKKQTLMELKSTAEKKQEQELRNCTFKPTILKTPKALTSTAQVRSSSSKTIPTVFDSLYNQHRAKIERQRRLLQQQQNQRKAKTGMLGKQHLEEFFNRNAQYMQEKKHREELLQLVSSQYDLTSGRKLFQPKINGAGQGGLALAKFNSNSINQVHKQEQHNSSKTPKSARPSLNSPKTSGVKTHFRSNSSNLMKSKDHQAKVISQKGKQIVINNGNHQGQFRAKAYQLSKFTDEVPESYQYDDEHDCEDDTYQDRYNSHECQQDKKHVNHMGYTPKLGIFNKTRVVEQLFETNEQEGEQQELEDQQQSRHNLIKQMKLSHQLIINLDDYEQNQQQQQGQMLKYNSEYDAGRVDNSDGDDAAHAAEDQSYKREEGEYKKEQDPQGYSRHPEDETSMSQEIMQRESNRFQSSLHEQNDLNDTHIQDLQYAVSSQNQYQANKSPPLQQAQTTKRKPSQDNDSTMNRSTFLQSIVKNPIYSHKYHDLFALQSSQLTQIHKDYDKLENSPSQSTPSTGNKQLFKPLFLAKDSQEEENQQKLPNKSWQQIFTASTKIDKTKTVPPSESGFTQNSRISQMKPNSSLPLEESPKKKAINIASLLKAKKRQVPKQ